MTHKPAREVPRVPPKPGVENTTNIMAELRSNENYNIYIKTICRQAEHAEFNDFVLAGRRTYMVGDNLVILLLTMPRVFQTLRPSPSLE